MLWVNFECYDMIDKNSVKVKDTVIVVLANTIDFLKSENA